MATTLRKDRADSVAPNSSLAMAKFLDAEAEFLIHEDSETQEQEPKPDFVKPFSPETVPANVEGSIDSTSPLDGMVVEFLEAQEKEQHNRQDDAAPTPIDEATGQRQFLEESAAIVASVEKRWGSRFDSDYTTVKVLLVRWDNDKADSTEELESLEEVFYSTFAYDVETFLIPDERPERALLKFLIDWVSDAPDVLQIFVYNGHGGIDETQNSGRWCSGSKSGVDLNMSSIQSVLEESRSDTLLIYDCCHSANWAIGKSNTSVTDLIAASGFEAHANTGDLTLTKTLTKILHNAGRSFQKISVAELYRRVFIELRKAGQDSAATTPIWVHLTTDEKHQPGKQIIIPPPGLHRKALRRARAPASEQMITFTFAVEQVSARVQEQIANWLLKAPRQIRNLEAVTLASSTQKVDIKILRYGDTSFKISVGAYESLPAVKQRIFEASTVAIDDQQLFCGARPLEGNKQLVDCFLPEFDFAPKGEGVAATLALRKRGDEGFFIYVKHLQKQGETSFTYIEASIKDTARDIQRKLQTIWGDAPKRQYFEFLMSGKRTDLRYYDTLAEHNIDKEIQLDYKVRAPCMKKCRRSYDSELSDCETDYKSDSSSDPDSDSEKVTIREPAFYEV